MTWHRLIQDTRRRPTCCQLCCMRAALVPPVHTRQLDPKIERRLELVQQRLLPLQPTHEQLSQKVAAITPASRRLLCRPQRMAALSSDVSEYIASSVHRQLMT